MRGARSRGPDASTRGGSGRPLQVCQTAGPGGVNSALPSRLEHVSDHSPRPSRFLEPSACRGARPNGRGGVRRGKEEREGEEERRPRARPWRRHEESARSPLFPPPGGRGQPARDPPPPDLGAAFRPAPRFASGRPLTWVAFPHRL